MARDLNKLKVYELADDLAVEIYRLTTQAPAEERFGLALQLRQAAAAAPLAIVEACGRGTALEFLQGLEVAQTAASKVRYLLSLCRRMGQLSGPACAMAEGRSLHLVKSLQCLMKAERVRWEARVAKGRLQAEAS